MKRAAALFILAGLMLALPACGGKTAPPSPTAAVKETAAPAPMEAPAPAETPAPAPEPTPAEAEAPAPTEKPDWESLGARLYEGKCKGYGGYVHVTVVLDEGGKILDVIMGRHGESEDYGDLAIDVIPAKIVETQSLGLDAVTGATITSEAILQAAANALTEAGLDPADYGFTP